MEVMALATTRVVVVEVEDVEDASLDLFFDPEDAAFCLILADAAAAA